MPWLAIAHSDSETRKKLGNMFEVKGIPFLVLIDAETGKIITKNARNKVASDPEAAQFPWA